MSIRFRHEQGWWGRTFRPKSAATLGEDASRHGLIALGLIVVYLVWGPTSLVLREPLRGLIAVPALDDYFVAFASGMDRASLSEREIATTIVAFDDASVPPAVRSVGVPRCKLPAVIERIARGAPAAIVVDAGLTGPEDPSLCEKDGRDLGEFLGSYIAGPPLILVRGLHETSPSATSEPLLELEPTKYDEVVRTKPHIRWAHAFYEPDEDNVVRRWRGTFIACDPNGVVTAIDAVPLAILAASEGSGASGFVPEARRFGAGQCTSGDQRGDEYRLPFARDPSVPISAAQLLTHEFEDSALFTNRVVVIGATHSETSDVWDTPVRPLYGVELLAQTIRFAPLRLDAPPETKGFVAVVFGSFLILAICAFLLRPGVALVVAAVALSTVAIVGQQAFLSVRVLDTIEYALWMFLEFELILAVLAVIADQSRSGSFIEALLAARFRRDED